MCQIIKVHYCYISGFSYLALDKMYESADLITGSDILLFAIQVNALGNVRGLLLQSHQHIASLVIKAYKSPKISLSKMFQLIIIGQNKVVLGQILHQLNLSVCANKICRPTIVNNNLKKKNSRIFQPTSMISVALSQSGGTSLFIKRVIIRLQDLL